MGVALAALPLAACQAAPARAPAAVPVAEAQALRVLPHDTGAFTEGLFIDGDTLFESTGMEGRSSLRRVDLETGRVQAQMNLSAPLFGEGIAPFTAPDGSRQILMLTWRNAVGFRFARDGLAVQGRFTYVGEGWGMTSNGAQIIMSDGTDQLRFINGADFTTTRLLRVTANGRPIVNLNELEWVDGEILANIWLTDRIARIDPATGHVKGWIDLSPLRRKMPALGTDQVANGIAWDAVHRRLYVTGKEWPAMFQIAWPVAGRRAR
ncbi:glutaminyl-peptide cyclotransferase [Novosphingobium sp. FSY-8]|uniref:Glutaminyl-peptide cyclotransferase n=2 Tax=Novosphingobium ovatum TaxID=1908523 RepID=A0ABW9XHB5_9SPHN|nr:glutaminyl-peptide cyclotransferase [Novosphingobium ovatum]